MADELAHAAGAHSAAVGVNHGIVQTGPGSQVHVSAVAIKAPAEVDPPAPGIFGVPRPATRVFVGRDEQLTQLDALVHAGAGVVTQAVHGLGGIGKTELALQFATRHRARYGVVWWINAESPDEIQSGLAGLAYRLQPGLAAAYAPAEGQSWALAWLESHAGWLLVLDNVEERRQVEPLLGQLTTGHVLITSRRDAGWEDVADGCLRLDVLTEAAAVRLLTEIAGPDESGAAAALARDLGCLPLALQQAGAYLRQTRTGMAGYLRRLRTEPARLLAKVPGDAERAVSRTWALTVEAIAGEDPLALRVLRILSCLAPEALPRDVLHPLADAGQVDDALGVLASYNMITLTAETVAVHRLVQAVTAADLGRPDDAGDHLAPAWGETLREAIGLLHRAAPADDPRTDVTHWYRWTALSPHVAAAGRKTTDPGLATDHRELFAAAALFDDSQGRYDLALEHGIRAWAITVTAHDDLRHPEVAGRLDAVANGLRRTGHPEEAERFERDALDIAEASLGPDDAEVGLYLLNLGTILYELGRYAEAEQAQRRALAISEATAGPEDRGVANCLSNLGVTLNALGRPAEAEPLLRRALAIDIENHGIEHIALAYPLNSLAQSLQDLGRPDEAERWQRIALKLTAGFLGANHPDVADQLNNYAFVLRELGRGAEAVAFHRRALGIAKDALGVLHPRVADHVRNLSSALYDAGEVDEARHLAQVAAAMAETADRVNRRIRAQAGQGDAGAQ